MPRTIHILEFPGHMTRRGFSIYVWEIEHTTQGTLLYVGRTGDSSSPNASSPIRRMGQHFHPVSRGNTLYRWLHKRGVEVDSCTKFKLFSCGPFFGEITPDGTEPDNKAEARKQLMGRHRGPRDVVAGLEKALADTLRRVEYNVMNPVHGMSDTKSHLWHEVLRAFTRYFPKLEQVSQDYPCGPGCALFAE